jgi:hypothetical protein
MAYASIGAFNQTASDALIDYVTFNQPLLLQRCSDFLLISFREAACLPLSISDAAGCSMVCSMDATPPTLPKVNRD